MPLVFLTLNGLCLACASFSSCALSWTSSSCPLTPEAVEDEMNDLKTGK